MIDRDHLEQAGLHALDLLDESERDAFERECRVNPALQEALRDAGDLVSAIGATAAPHTPDARNLEVILARVSERTPRRSAHTSGAAAWRMLRESRLIPWSAAAVFAALAIWFGWQARSTGLRAASAGHRGSESPHGTTGAAREGGREIPTWPGMPKEAVPSRDAANVADSADGARGRIFPNRALQPEFRLQQDTARLKAELEKLRALESARQQPPEGVSDLRLVEMRPPGSKAPAANRELLSSRVADAIAAGLDARAGSKPSTPSDPANSPPVVSLSGDGASPAGDITIETGMLNIGTLNLHPDAQVIHRNFPRDEDFARYGLTRLDENTVWDGNGGLWHRSADGRTWIGQKAPPNWQAPEPEEAPLAVPTLRPPPARPDSAPVDDSGAASDGAIPQPYALPVLDHSGQGTLIVQNLPPPPDGMVYHLWLRDPRMAEPSSVGILPPLLSPNDHFSFDLGTPGYVPTGYLLTIEPPGPVDVPRGKVVLQGP